MAKEEQKKSNNKRRKDKLKMKKDIKENSGKHFSNIAKRIKISFFFVFLKIKEKKKHNFLCVLKAKTGVFAKVEQF